MILGHHYYIVHTNYNPLIREPSFTKNWIKRTLDFWLPFADQAAENNITICMENIWDPGPDIQAEIVSKANHPNLRVSFDNGHALVFSDIPAKTWIETVSYTHLRAHET